MSYLIFAFIFILAGPPVPEPGIYVSSSVGADTNAGTADSPVKTLAEASVRLISDTAVYLKRGDAWTNETLSLVNQVDDSSELIVDAFGAGARPVLTSSAIGIAVTNSGQLVIRNIDLEDCGEGISFYYSGVSNLTGTCVSNCGFRGNTQDILFDGIYDNELRPQFNIKDVEIVDCVSYGAGLFVNVEPFTNVKVSANGFPVRNLSIRNCISAMSQQSHILLRFVAGGAVDGFLGLYGNRVGGGDNGHAGILLRRCLDYTVQNSEIAHFGRPSFKEIDGEAIDFEGQNSFCGITNCVIRHSAGPGVLLYQKNARNAYNVGCWLRDNDFWYNGQNAYRPEDCDIWIDDDAVDLFYGSSGHIENNRYRLSPGNSFTLAPLSRSNHNWVVTNNIADAEYPDFEWNYNYENGLSGFMVNAWSGWSRYISPSVGDGALRLTIDVSGDPSLPAMFSLDDQNDVGLDTGLDIPAADYGFVHLRMQNNTACTNVTLRWKTELDMYQYTAANAWSFPISENDSGFQNYVVDLNGHPGWTGMVETLRFEFPDSGNGNVDVDYIRVKSTDAVAISLQPPQTTAWEFETIGNVEDWVTHVRCEADVSKIRDGAAGDVTGMMVLMATGGDPYVITRPLTGISAADYGSIQIKMRNATPDNGAQIFWKRTTDSTFCGPVNFAMQGNAATGENYAVQLENHPDWNGEIEYLRFDFLRHENRGLVLVDSIRMEE